MLDRHMLQMLDWALEEDLGAGDCTSKSSVPAGLVHEGFILAKEEGVVAGIEVAEEVFRRVDPSVTFEAKLADGSLVKVGDVVIRIQGNARSILAAERLALNFMQRMSGVATTTHRAMDVLKGTPTRVLDTRKTTPGLRAFEKWGVRLGGRQPQDGAVRHDPHQGQPRGLCREHAGGFVGVKTYFEAGEPQVPVVVEVRSMEELNEALAASKRPRTCFWSDCCWTISAHRR